MKKVIALALAAALGGCTTFGSFQNPVTRSNLVAAKSAYGIVLTAAVTYRKLCNEKIIKRATCAPVVVQMQSADQKVQIALKNLRVFQAANPSVDAASLIIAIEHAVADFQAVASINGVK